MTGSYAKGMAAAFANAEWEHVLAESGLLQRERGVRVVYWFRGAPCCEKCAGGRGL